MAVCSRIGLIVVCLNTHTIEDELSKVLENTNPKVLLFQTILEEKAEAIRDLLPVRKLYIIDEAAIPWNSFDQFIDEDHSSLTEPQPVVDEGWIIIPTTAVDGILQGRLSLVG